VNVLVTGSGLYYAPGQAFVGATLDINPPFGVSGPHGLVAGTASIVPIQ
jgi:hypothetical protein